ncbi:MAG TPA: hypothetical protein VGE55_01800 [Limnobacter sp.]|uniref:hypothetical protein n=1 Tax=Limnobacter sp. TaxID=2003368 RepID=UPI002ED89082
MKLEGLPSPQLQQKTQALLSHSISAVQGAMAAQVGEDYQNQRLQGRALSGQFMGYDPQGLAKLKVGNLVVRLLLPVGAKPPAIGATLVVNITARDSILRGAGDLPGELTESSDFVGVLSRQALLQSGASDLEPDDLSFPAFRALHSEDVQTDVSESGQLLGKLVQAMGPREGVRLVLMATQLGLLSRVLLGEPADGEQRPPERMHPLTEALGLIDGGADDLRDNATQLARQLQLAIQRSGLFYESHVRLWREGKWTLTELGEEPQSDWGQAQALAGTEASFNPEQNKSAWLTNLQLNLLHTPRLSLVMPGLTGEPIHLTIAASRQDSDDPPDESSAEQAAQPTPYNRFEFDIRMQLPTLGRVHAQGVIARHSTDLTVTFEEGKQPPESAAHQLSRALSGARVQVQTFPDENA